MASEIRVNKIENRSGLGTVTFADTGVDLAGIVTATTFSGSGASLTSLPAAQVTGTLPAISGANLTNLTATNLTGTIADARFPATLPAASAANLTNVPAANVVGVHTSLTITNATTTGTAVVGGGVTISESGIEASGIGITCANINGTQIGGRRNLIINGAMEVAQRGTSSTSVGYQTVDRFITYTNGVDEAPTFAQADVSSGTSPYAEGFRKSFKITNGNQTGGAGSGDYVILRQKVESQNLAKSGWNYTSSSSFVTLSFWVKASVAQTYYFSVLSSDGTLQNFPMETGSLSANTWTKITKTIPGASGVQFNNDTGIGLEVDWWVFAGTDYTASGVALDTWAAFSGSTRFPDQQQTWYTTNDATFEITGLQLEVGPQATPFEHRTQGEELQLCQRYFQKVAYATGSGGSDSGNLSAVTARFATPMRSAPTITVSGVLNAQGDNALNSTQSSTNAGQSNYSSTENMYVTYVSNFSNVVQGRCYFIGIIANNSNQFLADAEI